MTDNDFDPDWKPERDDIITERLKDKAFDTWTYDDLVEEQEASTAAFEKKAKVRENMQFVRGLIDKIWVEHPDITFGEAINMLPEPERTMARDIMNLDHERKVDLAKIPIERTNRQAWHGLVEQTALNFMQSGRARFTLDELLDAAGIPRNVPELRKQAEKYARRFVDAVSFQNL